MQSLDRLKLLALAAFAMAGCGAGEAGAPDAGAADAPAADAGAADAPHADAGGGDAPRADAGAADAPIADAAVLDAPLADAGTADAAVVDAGPLDAGAADAAAADAGSPDAAPIACDPSLDYTGTFPSGAKPCTDQARWPHTLTSAALPIVVHYPRCEHSAIAGQILGLVEHAWQVETGPLGFSPPLPDGGRCGADDAFDVFVWPGAVETYVEALEANPATPHDDWFTFMVLDPWGPYGGDLLDSTIAHELNHACQATDDWWEHVAAFEMTATFMEDVVYPAENDWLFVLDDFQAHPDWSIDRDDGYETWFMYGAALLLHLVRERYFEGDAAFAGAMWRASRNPPGDNEPDFEDALEALLNARAGVGFADAVVELAAWRWYTGDRDDGLHFAKGALFPRPATAETVMTTPANVFIDPMAYGSAYVDLLGAGSRHVELVPDAPGGVTWVLQLVPGTGGATADALDPSGDTIVLDGLGLRTLVVTALPTGGRDPDDQTDTRHGASLIVSE